MEQLAAAEWRRFAEVGAAFCALCWLEFHLRQFGLCVKFTTVGLWVLKFWWVCLDLITFPFPLYSVHALMNFIELFSALNSL